jgi:Co/Zn/Cd efflux system component
LAVAGYVQTAAHESLSMTTLSHLLFFDALGAFLCVAVHVSRNFEVWNRSTISHPFGLERSEVLAGLAMSIILLFMGIDLISHGLTHALEDGGHHQHHHHDHDSPENRAVAALLAMLGTVVTAVVMGGGRARTDGPIDMSLFQPLLPSTARSQSHFLPLTLSMLLLSLPLLGVRVSPRADAALGSAYALAMVALGARLCHGVGRMLLMSYSSGGGGVRDVVAAIARDGAVAAVDEAKVWQVHYGLCVASFRLRVRAADQAARVRDGVAALVRDRLGGGYGAGSKGVRWEVSTQITVER